MNLRLLISSKALRGRRPLLDDLAGRAFVMTAPAGKAVLEALGKEVVDLAVLERADLGDDPWTQVAAIRALPEAPEIVLIDKSGSFDEQAAALAVGCLAVLDGTRDPRELAAALVGVCDRLQAVRRLAAPMLEHRFGNRLESLGTRSSTIKRFQSEARAAALSHAPVLIVGEPGSGRTLLGPALHMESSRSAGPFRRVRCTGMGREDFEGALFGHESDALPGSARAKRGLCEEAHGGTLYLENLDEAAPEAQATLARFIDDLTVRPIGGDKAIPVNVRILMSMPAQDPERARPELATELFGRAGLQTLSVPPLRERRDDLPDLAHIVLRRLNKRYGFSLQGFDDDALGALSEHTWPGNLSELWSVIERACLVARGSQIECADLPADFASLFDGAEPVSKSLRIEADWLGDATRLPSLRELRERCLDVVDRAYLAEVLRASGGRIEDSARRAGLDPRSLRTRMRTLGLRKEDFKLGRAASREEV